MPAAGSAEITPAAPSGPPAAPARAPPPAVPPPEHEVLSLDRDSLSDHVELPSGFGGERQDITVQKLSALARLALLSRHGGAWADATVLCTRTLDAWLEPYRGAGFFAFRDPGRDRMISNWFIAAEPQSLILKRLS